MNIFGEKIVIRAIETKDSDMLLSIINDPETEYMLGGWSFPVSSQNQTEWINSLKYNTKTLRGVIELKDTEEAIGVVMLTDIDYKNGNAEIHIKLVNGDFKGQGYGTDAIKTIVKYAFEELRLHVITSKVNSYNEASKRLFNKCGFSEEGILRGRLFKRGNYIDIISYSVINGELGW